MKLNSILTLNEGTYSKLAEWEAAAKKLGYTVTKDNKSGTYHAWDGTAHKGQFTAPTSKGYLTEATAPRKDTVAWEREQQRKKKERDPEEAKRIEKIGDKNHQVGNAKVAHESTSRAYEIGYDAFLADKTKCPYQPGSDDATDWNLGWEAAQSRERSNEGVKEGTVHYGQPANTQSFKVTYYDPKYDETRTSVIKSRSKEAALEFCTAKGYDVQSIEQQGVKESAGEPNVDDILYYLTSGYRTLQKYPDSYQDFSVITRIYDSLCMDLKGGNYIAFSQSYNNYLERYPDAAAELYDAMFEAAGLPADEGTIEEFMQKCSGVTEGVNESYVIIRTDSEGKKDVFAGGFDTYEKAQKELDDCLAHPLHTKHKQKFEIERKGRQGVKEGLDKQALKQKYAPKALKEQKALAQPDYKSIKYKHYTVRQEGPKQWAIVGATVRRFATLLAAQNYIDKRL